MVEIRTIKPTIKISMPQREKSQRWAKYNAARIRVERRRCDFLPPTPQPTPCVIWQGSVDRKGYGRLKVQRGNKRITLEAHRWVMEQLLGRRLKSWEVVLHACDNPPCFAAAHLSVGTVADNNYDMFMKGRNVKPPINVYRGECHPMAKLTAAQVRAIRGHYQSGLKAGTIAEMYDMSPGAIRKIVRGVSWATSGRDLIAEAQARRERDE